jgi:hypothetical protein
MLPSLSSLAFSVWKVPLSTEEAIAVGESVRRSAMGANEGAVTTTAAATERPVADTGPIVKPVSHSWREHRRKKLQELQQHEQHDQHEEGTAAASRTSVADDKQHVT